jgi:hypothetical protein
LPSSSINSALASPAFSRFLLLLAVSSPLLPSTSAMGKSKRGGSYSHHSSDKHKREPTPPSEDFGDSEYSEEEFSPPSLRALRLLPLPWRRLMIQTTPRGSPRRYGPTSGPSSVPGSRARMSRSTPRMRRIPPTRPRREAAATTVTATTLEATVTEAAAAAAARAVTTAARVAAETAAATARAAARAATRPVARRHWF